MKKIFTTVLGLFAVVSAMAQGWPSNYGGVMLQGFYWDSFSASKWTTLEAQANELADYFDLVWIPQSAYCGSVSMGYDDLYWFTNYNSSFGNEAQLRSLIKTFKGVGIGTIADVVINHRKTLNSWVDFPAETYKGVTYQLKSTDICANDDGGATKKWADANGYKLSSNNDTGEDWSGMRDIDHNSENVQRNVKAYLDMLLNDLGYVGFRYDMVKGYNGKFTGIYNSYAKPAFSVGEYWDGNKGTVESWLNATKTDGAIQSAAFDFPIRYTVRDAVNNGNWSKLDGGGVCKDEGYQQFAVTFVENHDTEYRSAESQQDPIRKDTLAANAYIMGMPGTPSVFLKHWIDCKADIKQMINARKFAGITNTSKTAKVLANDGYYAFRTTGDNCVLYTVVGTNASQFGGYANWVKLHAGHHYAYYIDKSAQTAWTSLPSGDYEGEQTVTLHAASANTTDLVYTLDGTVPTAKSQKVASGTVITLPYGITQLQVGLLINGVVSGIVSRTYSVKEVKPFTPYEITVYVKNPGWDAMYFHTWGDYREGTSWPGDRITTTIEKNGAKWYYKSYTISGEKDYVNFVFNAGSNKKQTEDVTGITSDTYFEINDETDGSGHYLVKLATGISSVTNGPGTAPAPVYSIDGRLVRTKEQGAAGLPKGVYISGGKKFVVK